MPFFSLIVGTAQCSLTLFPPDASLTLQGTLAAVLVPLYCGTGSLVKIGLFLYMRLLLLGLLAKIKCSECMRFYL